MHLDSFSYYFKLENSKGGACSLTFNFYPDFDFIKQDVTLAGLKQTLQQDFGRLEIFFDEDLIKKPLIKARKIPILTDSPARTEAGYDYKKSLFPLVELTYSLQKGNLTKTSAKINLSVRLGHTKNISVLDRILALPKLTVSSHAKSQIESLRQIIQKPLRTLTPNMLLT